jgi:hypothetical protein
VRVCWTAIVGLTCGASRFVIALAAVFLPFSSAALAFAQDQSTATLKITVVTIGAAGSEAVVEVQSRDDPRIVRSASGDPMRPVELRALPPGRYRVVVSRAGDESATREVSFDPGEVVSMVATLAAARSGRSSTIDIGDRYHAGDSVVIREPALGGLPASSHVWSLIDALVHWTLVDGIDAGGVETGRRGLFGARDGSWTWNSFVMDGVDLTDPTRPGTPLQHTDAKALEAITITSGLAPAEVAAPGAQVTLVPRKAGTSRDGSVEFSGTSVGMVSKRPLDVAPPIAHVHSWGDVNAQVGGPLRTNGGLFVAGRLTRSDFVDRGAAIRQADLTSAFAHLVMRPTDTDQVRVVVSGQRTSRPLEGGDAFLGRAVDETDTFTHAQVRWERAARGGTVGSAALAFQRGTFSPNLDAPVTGGVVDRIFDGPVPSPAADTTSRRIDLQGGVMLPPHIFGRTSHAFRATVSFTSARATSHILAAPDVAERAGGVPARVWQFVVPTVDSQRPLSHVSTSVADDMRLGDHLVMDAGVRLDRWQGRAAGAAAGLTKVTVAPRLSARANFPGFGIAAYGGIGRYAPAVPTNWLAFGDPGEAYARLYRWTDPNGDGRFDASERGAQVALAGWGAPIGSIDPNLRLPDTMEYVLGGELRLGTAVIRCTATIRHEHHLVRAVNTGIPLSSYTQFLIPDQTDQFDLLPVYNRPAGAADLDRYVLTNPDDGGLTYHALDLVYDQPITPRFRMRASAIEWWTFGPGAAPGFTVLENDQGLIGELFQDPNTTSQADGANFFDRSYVLKWSGTYAAPRDIWFSFTANYRDGQPFAGLIVQPDLTQGPEIIQSYRRGRTRFTFTVLFDTLIEKRFAIRGRRAALWLAVYNLANLNEEVEENPVLGSPVFRASTALQPPRTFRVGFRMGF